MNYQIDTGKTTKYTDLIKPGCGRCAHVMSELTEWYENGSTIRGGHFHVLHVDEVFPTDEMIIEVVLTNSADAADVIDTQGNLTQHFDPIPPTQLGFYVDISTPQPAIDHFFYIGTSE